MSFQIFKDFKVEEDYIQGSEEDIYYNKNLKSISQIYLKNNGYDLGDEKEVHDMSNDEFSKIIEEKSDETNTLTKIYEKNNIEINLRSLMSNIYKNPNGKKIFIFFLPTDSNSKNVGINYINIFSYLLISLDCKDGLLISKKQLTPDGKKKIRAINIAPSNDLEIYNVDYYVDNEFFPLCLHSLIPKVLKIYRYPEESLEFKKENNNIDISKFPRMIVRDPLVKFYRGKAGDIFKLERKNINDKNILSTQIIYRFVINSTLNKSTKK